MISRLVGTVSRHALAAAAVAMLLAAGGSAWAAGKIGSSDIKDASILSRHLARGAVGSRDLAGGAVEARHLGLALGGAATSAHPGVPSTGAEQTLATLAVKMQEGGALVPQFSLGVTFGDDDTIQAAVRVDGRVPDGFFWFESGLAEEAETLTAVGAPVELKRGTHTLELVARAEKGLIIFRDATLNGLLLPAGSG